MTWQRSVFETMGTVASVVFDAPDDRVIGDVERLFAEFDGRYSLYQQQSELSRVARGELRLEEASSHLLSMYADALDWRAHSGGNFTPHRPDGVIDLSGIVKAAAMSAAADLLLKVGARDWCLNVGGDVLVAGRDEHGRDWTVGIVDPADRRVLVTKAPLVSPRRACATSGSAERGEHIWTSGAEPTPFVQVSVLADDIVSADVLATAIVSGGTGALDSLCLSFDIDVLTVDRNGELRATPGFAELVKA